MAASCGKQTSYFWFSKKRPDKAGINKTDTGYWDFTVPETGSNFSKQFVIFTYSNIVSLDCNKRIFSTLLVFTCKILTQDLKDPFW